MNFGSLIRKARDIRPNNFDGQYFVVSFCLNKRGDIISIGCNNYLKSHPYQKAVSSRLIKFNEEDGADYSKRIYLHAEISSIVKAKKKINSIFVVRFLKDGGLAKAKPCRICELAIKEAGIKEVYYTSESGIKGEVTI